MKKNGFTLAEVLITLAIIGVVASLTLPALMTNTGEQQAKSALKKGVNTLTEAAKMNDTLLGWDFAGAVTKSDYKTDMKANATTTSALNLLRQRTSIDRDNSGTKFNTGKILGASKFSGYNVVFTDGTALMFDPTAAQATEANTMLQDDGLPLGFAAIYDTNGTKAPNQLSNCKGKQIGQEFNAEAASTNDEPATATGLAACNDAKKRAIKDQFEIRIRGSVIQPRGAAAAWAYNN